jgi:hypothetical protein
MSEEEEQLVGTLIKIESHRQVEFIPNESSRHIIDSEGLPIYSEPQPQLTIRKSIADMLDKELGNRTDIFDFIYGVGEYGFYSKKLTEWVTNNDEFDEESKRRGNVSAAYLAGKALGVDLVKVVEND